VRVKEAAIRLEVGVGTVYALVAAGKLRCYRVGVGRGTIRVSEEQIAEFLASCETGPKPVAPLKPKFKQYVPKYDHGF
jgi:excisionase family DNA binding protein